MTLRPRTHRLARAAGMIAVAVLAAGPARAAAAPAQAAEPLVTISATSPGGSTVTDCKGTTRTDVDGPITVTVTRTGDTASPLTVTLSYGGTLASSSGLPTQATIAAGEASATLTADEATGGYLNATVVDGDGYAVGNPGFVTAYVNLSIADLGCNIGNPRSEQTIEVGTTPAPVDVVKVAYGPPDSLARSIEGTPPPGTTFHLDGTFSGTATEVGVSFLRMYFCSSPDWCPYRADIEVTVVESDAPTTTEAPGGAPATPASAATPVAATPQLTG